MFIAAINSRLPGTVLKSSIEWFPDTYVNISFGYSRQLNLNNVLIQLLQSNFEPNLVT